MKYRPTIIEWHKFFLIMPGLGGIAMNADNTLLASVEAHTETYGVFGGGG